MPLTPLRAPCRPTPAALASDVSGTHPVDGGVLQRAGCSRADHVDQPKSQGPAGQHVVARGAAQAKGGGRVEPRRRRQHGI